MSKVDFEQLAIHFKAACFEELQALKPGNVHVFADGHGMVVEDFIKSAEAVANIIVKANLSVGKRILESVIATQSAAHCNTNLGIILLCAPLVQASFLKELNEPLKNALTKVLSSLTIADAIAAYEAIRIANPAGLGTSVQDVKTKPTVTLLQAMQLASERDLIAHQYTNSFVDVIEKGAVLYTQAIHQWGNATWAVTYVYLYFLANNLDSHIFRKHGLTLATLVQNEAKQYWQAFSVLENPKTYFGKLLSWDKSLKFRGVNPGTTADLTVATIFYIKITSR